MAKYVAFLRAINVGGHVVKMDALKALFETLDFSNVETFIASGNVIFETKTRDTAALEAKIERALEKSLGYEVSTFLRTPAQITAITKYQPFEPSLMASAAAINVGMLKAPLCVATCEALARLKTDIDDFHVNEAHLFWICKMRQSESKISNAVFERTLKVKATFRGLRTMERLAAKYGSL
ncbi:MAG: DUF1697 domain-containing protein [Vicinamibacteria bacterium]